MATFENTQLNHNDNLLPARLSILDWIATALFAPLFIIFLLLFHIATVISLPLGQNARNIVFSYSNYVAMILLRVVGISINIGHLNPLPDDTPIIIVSNHQSMFDMPMIIWTFRKFKPKFIAKKELGRYIPGVSINLRNGAGVLIDRSNPPEAVKAIEKACELIKDKSLAISIFPEGTRARNGKMKRFKTKGLLTLFKNLKEAVVVPLVVKNTWKITAHNFLPMHTGFTIEMKPLNPIKVCDYTPEDLIKLIETRIKKELGNYRTATK